MNYITISVNEQETKIQALLLDKKYIVNCTNDAILLATKTGGHLLVPSKVETEVKRLNVYNEYSKEFLGMPTIIEYEPVNKIINLPKSQGNTLYYVKKDVFEEAVKEGRSDVITGTCENSNIPNVIDEKIITHLTCAWQTKDFQKMLLEQIVFYKYHFSSRPERVSIVDIDDRNVTTQYRGRKKKFEYKNLEFEEIK
jgi:hypothetical protein